MATNKAFKTKQSNFNDYMAQLDELLRKNRGSALYQGYDVNPNAQLLPGKVRNPLGLGEQQYNDRLQYDKYVPQSTTFEAPTVGQVAPYYEQEQNNAQPTQTISAQDFFNQVAQAIYSPKLPSQQSTEELEQIYQQTGQKYATASMPNGQVKYNDGSVGLPQAEAQSQPIASLSDGNILWSDGWVRPQLPDYMQGSGVQALSQGLFGSNQTVTQPYGVVNPIEPTPGMRNIGTDFRTRDLAQHEIRNYFSEPFEVVEVYNQANPGSGYLGSRENRGYGNSILLRRQDGSMIRISHFDQIGNFNPGDVIQPGQLIGVPGTTGNITGEHSDVEVYSPEGSIVSPDDFIASVRESSPSQDRLYEYGKPQASFEQPQAEQPQQQPQPIDRKQAISQVVQEARDFAQQFKPENVAQTIETNKPTGDLGVGATELMRGDLPAARQELRQTEGKILGAAGKAIGAPEFYGSEVVSGELPLGQAISKNIEEKAPQGKFDAGISELARKDFSGAAKVLGSSLRQVGEKVTDPFRKVGEKVGETIKTGTQNLISRAKDAFGNVDVPGAMQKPSTLDLDPNAKVVGAVSNTSQAGDMPIKGGDIRDPFFKYGGSEQYADYLKQGADQLYGGALNTGVFKPEFYQNPKAVGDVFGNTSQSREATGKYKDYLQSQIKPGFDQPYREEIKGDWKYKIPVREYWENKYWNDRIAETPDQLSGDASYQDFVEPEIKRQAFKGERQSIPGDAPTFKSNVASLFAQAGDRAGQFIKGIGQNISDVYKPHPFSRTVAQPDKIASYEGDKKPASMEITMPETTRTRYSRPTLSDYLSRGKTAAQFYAETGQQSSLDAMGRDPRNTVDFRTGSVSRVGSGGGIATGPGQNYSSEAGHVASMESKNRAVGGVSSGPKQNFTPSYANYTSRTGAYSYAPPPRQTSTRVNTQSNPFTKTWNKIKQWF